jgi:alkylated DNA repair protein alkB homolog 6
VAARLLALGIFAGARDGDDERGFPTPHQRPNHVLVNEYRPGEGIMPHEDGAAYAPVVATVTLGGYGVLDLWPKQAAPGDEGEPEEGRPASESQIGGEDEDQGEREPVARLLQEPRSLLVTTGTAYTAFLHGIAAQETDVGLVPPLSAPKEEEQEEDAQAAGPASGGAWAINHRMIAQPGSYTGDDATGALRRETRVSLTYRDVLKVSRLGGKLLGRRI